MCSFDFCPVNINFLCDYVFDSLLIPIKTSGIDPRYDIYYFFDNIFILYLILSPQMITVPGLNLSTDARGTENCNSVPAGTEFQELSKIS